MRVTARVRGSVVRNVGTARKRESSISQITRSPCYSNLWPLSVRATRPSAELRPPRGPRRCKIVNARKIFR